MSEKQVALIIDGVLDDNAIDGWEDIIKAIDTPVRKRSVSGAFVALCVFGHQEKTPSLWLYPSERCICYGCGARGTRGELIAYQTRVQPSRVLASIGVTLPESIMLELDQYYTATDTSIKEPSDSHVPPGEEPF